MKQGNLYRFKLNTGNDLHEGFWAPIYDKTKNFLPPKTSWVPKDSVLIHLFSITRERDHRDYTYHCMLYKSTICMFDEELGFYYFEEIEV